jgi:parallel beta-helix repeat protein
MWNFRSVAALTLLSYALPAQALETFCVNTLAEFNQAWQAADDDDVEIRIVTGTYNMNNSCIDEDSYCAVSDNAIRIRGGYNASCSSRTDNPAATVLTAPGQRVFFGTFDEELFADFSMDRLTLRQMDYLQITLEDVFSGDYVLSLDRVWFDQIDNGVPSFVDLWIPGVDRAEVRNSLFTRNGETTITGIDDLVMTNNTFADNVFPIEIRESVGIISRNIFSRSGLDLVLVSQVDEDLIELRLVDNIYGTVNASDPLEISPVGTLNSSPQFVDRANLNFRLLATSPGINSGTGNAALQTQLDFDGNPRWFGDKPDRGAFESNIGTTAATIVVTNTNDSGSGSLRQAIMDANATANVNRIEFDIGASCGPRIINLNATLPQLTQSVVIDGYTQPGSARNTSPTGNNAVLCIIVNGQGSVFNGIDTASAMDGSVTPDGLAFGGFTVIALNLRGGSGHRLIGSQIGGQLGALTLLPSPIGVQVGSLLGDAGADDAEIGGTLAAQRNTISDCTDAGIRIGSGANTVQVANNHLGVGRSGEAGGEGNRDGLVIQGSNSLVFKNVISNNSRHGVRITGAAAHDNIITDNRIGITSNCAISCVSSFGNIEDGVRIENGANDNEVRRNTIRFNTDDGIVVVDAVRNALYRNVLTDNTEQAIDLGDDGASAGSNNSGPIPPGSGNAAQNRPFLQAAFGGQLFGQVQGTLTSANGSYQLDFYSAQDCPSGLQFPPFPGGDPDVWLGSAQVTISGGAVGVDGSTPFSAFVAAQGQPTFFNAPRQIVATATRTLTQTNTVDRRGTSEVSRCVDYDQRWFANGFE